MTITAMVSVVAFLFLLKSYSIYLFIYLFTYLFVCGGVTMCEQAICVQMPGTVRRGHWTPWSKVGSDYTF